MKKLAFLMLLFSVSAFAQTNTRWDWQATTVTGAGQMLPVLALPGAYVNFYTGCTALPCTTPAVTYAAATGATACPSNAQVVWQPPVLAGCHATADSEGNFGGWFQTGAYQYTVTVSGHVSGPYNFNVGGGGGGSPIVVEINGVPISPASPANLVDTTSVTWQFVGGNIEATAAGGSSGCEGSVPGDNTSTDCGFENRVGDTAATPASVSTYGAQQLATNAATNVIAVGNLNGSGLTGKDLTIFGDTNANNFHFRNFSTNETAVIIGRTNVNGTSGSPCSAEEFLLAIGENNDLPCQGGTIFEATMLGDSNFAEFDGTTPNTADLQDVVALGWENGWQGQLDSGPRILGDWDEAVLIGSKAGAEINSGGDVVAIGDFPLCCTPGSVSSVTVSDIIAIGDLPGSGIVNGESVDVLIGVTPGGASLANSTHSPGSEQIGIGDGDIESSFGTDVIGIGDSAIGSLHNASPSVDYFNTGNDVIGIGNHAGQANSTGADNIYIGDYAGCNGCGPTTIGNANTTGSHNVWIGDTAGQNTTAQLSNTIGIGYQAFNTASNQIVFGNPSMTQAILYGAPRFPSILSAPCVGTDASGNLINNPGCTGGGSFTYPAGTGVVTVAGGSAWGTTLGVQGTDTSLLSSGTISGTGVAICTDSSGGATTVGCPSTGMTWPAGGAGIPNYTGSSAWGTSYSASNTIPANFISTLNQNTTGTAAGLSGSQTANFFYAAPNGSSGTAAFRAIVAADIPTLNQNTTGNAGTATALAATPSLCTTGQAPTGILPNGNATGCASLAGAGVSSVAMTGDGVLLNATVPGSPITTSGTLAPTLHTQTANTVFAGPPSGSAASPTFRALVAADVPIPSNVTRSICSGTQALSTTNFTPGQTVSFSLTCTGAQVGDTPNCKNATNPSGVVGYDVTVNGGYVLTIDVGVYGSNVITINQKSSLLNTTFSSGVGAMSLVCTIVR